MLRGNLYGLIIALLTFVIAIVLAVREVRQGGVRVELIIQPVERPYQPNNPGTRPEREVNSAMRQ